MKRLTRSTSAMLKLVFAASLLLGLGACANLAYYAQAVGGQVRLMAATRPIPDLVDDAKTDPALRQQLLQASAIREFASRQLGLPDNGSYRSYADLARPYVVWNVFAADEFSVEPQQWCVMLIGCVGYRGYYDKKDAEHYADELKQASADVYIGGVPAYSTLGYFNDPLLNTFLRFGEQEVARIVFHELAHQVVFAKGDSAFNESFAVAVENEGLRRWLAQSTAPRLQDFDAQQERKNDFRRLIAVTRDQLRSVYKSALPVDEKRQAKAAVFADMQRSYAELKIRWGGYAGYDAWFSQPLNNATLASVSLYTKWVPAFDALLEQEQGNLPRFYQRVAKLAELSRPERIAALEALLAKHVASKS